MIPDLALPDPGGWGHDLHADGALQLLPRAVDHFGQLVILACTVALVRHSPLPQARPAAVAHGLGVGDLCVSLERGPPRAGPGLAE